jgi:pyridoxal phosphate phosphatase PHOSPHO2
MNSASGAAQYIVSDSNTFFIDTILRHLGIAHCFQGIYTNPAHLTSTGLLHLEPYVARLHALW